MSTRGEVTRGVSFPRNPEEIEKDKRDPAKRAARKEEFQGEWNDTASGFIATDPEVADTSKSAQAPPVPLHGSLQRTGVYCALGKEPSAAPPIWPEWVRTATEHGFKLLFHRFSFKDIY